MASLTLRGLDVPAWAPKGREGRSQDPSPGGKNVIPIRFSIFWLNNSWCIYVQKWEPAPARQNVIPRDVINFSPATSQCVWVTFYKIFSPQFCEKFFLLLKKHLWGMFHKFSPTSSQSATSRFYNKKIYTWLDPVHDKQMLMVHLMKYLTRCIRNNDGMKSLPCWYWVQNWERK